MNHIAVHGHFGSSFILDRSPPVANLSREFHICRNSDRMGELIKTHHHCIPVLVEGEIRYSVYRRRKGVLHYLKRHDSIKKCCAALRKAFPLEREKFTPSRLKIAEDIVTTESAKADDAGDVKKARIPQQEKRQFIGICREVRAGRNNIKWKVQAKYKTPKLRYSTQLEAATAIAMAQGWTLKDIKLKSALLPALPLAKRRKMMGMAMRLYKQRLPGDAVDADKHANSPKCLQIFKRVPGVIPTFFISKYFRDRADVLDCVDEVWKQECIRKRKRKDTDILYDVLCRSARRISKHMWSDAWRRSVGRNNYHWMNFHTMLMRLTILTTDKPCSTSVPFVFQASGTEYFVLDLNDAIRSNLANHISWGQGCLEQLNCIPKTGDDYVKCYNFDANLKPLVGACDDGCYVRKWLKRGFLRWLIKCRGQRVDFKSLTIREFIKCFPDQHKLLCPLLFDETKSEHQNLGAIIGTALKKLGYDDDVSLLSMHACLCDDWDAQTVLRSKDEDWIERNWKEMRKRLDAWYKRDGIYPHPGLLFMSCIDLE